MFQGEFQLCASAWHELAGRWGIKLNWSQLDGNGILLFLTLFYNFIVSQFNNSLEGRYKRMRLTGANWTVTEFSFF